MSERKRVDELVEYLDDLMEHNNAQLVHDMADRIEELQDEIVNLNELAKDRYCKMQTEIEELQAENERLWRVVGLFKKAHPIRLKSEEIEALAALEDKA